MSNYFYFQILQRPEDDSKRPAEFPNLRAQFKAAADKEGASDFTAVEKFLWSLRPMYGAEYEYGGFEEYVEKTLAREEMAAAQINVDVNFDTIPSIKADPMLLKMGMDTSIQRKDWQEKGIDIPEKRLTSVYIIAPKNTLAEAIEKVKAFAGQKQESDTHRGLGFNRAVAYQGLSEEKKAGFPAYREDNVGWFEIIEGVFFTIDRNMFERAKRVFGAADSGIGKNLPKIELEADRLERARWLKEGDASLGLQRNMKVPGRLHPIKKKNVRKP